MTFEIAKREAVPLMVALAGTSGSGKTYSALLLAAGIAGEEGKVGFIDTEAGRGSMYADDQAIIEAMPGGKYYIQKLTEPFTPQKYANAIKEAIKFGVDVLVIDSATHEWEGFGGCQDIAENNKLAGMPNWAMAKMAHKRLMNMLTQCPMHVIFCLRAREKSKPVKNPKTGKTEIVQCGLQPIQEKNFMYEMTLSLLLDAEKAGKPDLTKCPKPLLPLFSSGTLVTKEMGRKLREWSAGGESVDMQLRNLKRECREAATFGSDALATFYRNQPQENKAILAKMTDQAFQDEVRALAAESDGMPTEEAHSNKLFKTSL
jgi:hypothetical protein